MTKTEGQSRAGRPDRSEGRGGSPDRRDAPGKLYDSDYSYFILYTTESLSQRTRAEGWPFLFVTPPDVHQRNLATGAMMDGTGSGEYGMDLPYLQDQVSRKSQAFNRETLV